MGLKAKDVQARLADLRDENKNNPFYPKLKKAGEQLEVVINNNTFQGTPKEMLEKFKDTPFFMEEYDDLMNDKDDFISYNLKLIEDQLKSKYD